MSAGVAVAKHEEEAALASLVATIAKGAGIPAEAAETAAQLTIAALAAEGAKASRPRRQSIRAVEPAREPAREDTASRPFGTVLACKATKGCGAKLGSVVFSQPHGVLSVFECPQCKRRNDFVNDARGIRWVSPDDFDAFLTGDDPGP